MLWGATPAPFPLVSLFYWLIVHDECLCFVYVDDTCLKLYPWTIVHPTFPWNYVIVSFFFLELSVLACNNCLKVGVVFIYIRLKTLCQYLLNPKMEITTTHEILLFSLMLCTIVLFFGAMYAIELFIDSFLCVPNICSDSFRTSSVWNGRIVFFGILYSQLSFCLQSNSSSLLWYVFYYIDALVLKHKSTQLSWLLNMCSRRTLLASHNSSIVSPPLFFII